MIRFLALALLAASPALSALELKSSDGARREFTFDGRVWRTSAFVDPAGKVLPVASEEFQVRTMNDLEWTVDDYLSTWEPERGEGTLVFPYVWPEDVKPPEAAPARVTVRFEGSQVIRKVVELEFSGDATVDRLEVERFTTMEVASRGGRGEPVWVNPFSLASGPPMSFLNGLHPKSKFLAVVIFVLVLGPFRNRNRSLTRSRASGAGLPGYRELQYVGNLLKMRSMKRLDAHWCWIPSILASILLSSPTFAAQSIPFPDSRLPIFGLGWYAEDQPKLSRFPTRLQATFTPAVWGLAQHPSGARLRFRTDSRQVGLRARNPSFSNMHHMASIGENGFDLYVDGHYRASASPDGQGVISATWKVSGETALRDVEIYLPLYKAVTIDEVTLDDGAQVLPPKSYAVSKPVVYYGSSITQGGCASNPGGSYQAILERRLNADFINLGFSGAGLGEIQIAEAITELDPSCIVLDFWANPSFAIYQQKLPPFVAKLREKFPRVPILVVSPFYFSGEAADPKVAAEQSAKRAFCARFIKEARRSGDSRLLFVDGLEMLNAKQADGLVDGVHPNSLGFHYCANGLEEPIRRALKLR
jgi:lysophospholipase L1-like esterase